MIKRKFLRGKYYHLHNVGIEKKIIFVSKEDFDRFEAYLYLLNDTESPRAANFFSAGRKSSVFESARTQPLIAIAAYCLMPTRFDICATPLVEGGISKFMQKLQTAYTMYFNDKYPRVGNLFQGIFKSFHAASESDLKHVLARIHLSPLELFDTDWKEKNIFELEKMAPSVLDYRYSSVGEYKNNKHIITMPKKFPKFVSRAKDPNACIRYWVDYKAKVAY